MNLASLTRSFTSLRSGTRSLKTALAIYFLPISVLPTLLLSFYATRVFEDSTRDTLVRRAASERDAIVRELEQGESELLGEARARAASPKLIAAIREATPAAVREALAAPRPATVLRVFSPDGKPLGDRAASDAAARVSYLSKEGLRRVKTRGETLDRYFDRDTRGVISVARVLVRDKNRLYGVVEEERQIGRGALTDLKERRQADVVLLSRDLAFAVASFALSDEILKSVSAHAFRQAGGGASDPITVRLGETRYSAFVFDLTGPGGRGKRWGFMVLFLSLTGSDASVAKLRVAMVWLTILLVLVVALLILIFSNRLVRPIEALVLAMKRVKTGRVAQIPAIDSTYEIEYLVHSFNEMARNVSAAKRALEIKLEELHRANAEIRNTQTALVQSAKMISLGQLVAGVAHELNNPIGFIYSNMHHLNDYVAKIRELVTTYRKLQGKLPQEDRVALENLERAIELDYVLGDMEDLTKSCVEGANRTREIVLGLRTFSRMDESVFRPADLHEGIRSTLRLLSTEYRDRVQIHEELGEIPKVECSLSQLNQVFMNLLSNAVQAIRGRGDVWIRTRHEAGRVFVEIEDSGEGISPEAIEKIFDPFFTTKKPGQGTGLGLSIAYGLVQKHHGTIRVKSEIGRGTRFTIELPVAQPVTAHRNEAG